MSSNYTQQDRTCSICLHSIKDSTGLYRLPCLHEFHPPCVLSWFQRKQSCPICRQSPPPTQPVESVSISVDPSVSTTSETAADHTDPFTCIGFLLYSIRLLSYIYTLSLIALGITLGSFSIAFPYDIVFITASTILILYAFHSFVYRHLQV